MLKLLAEAFENLTKVFRKTKNPAVKDELIKIGDELEALSEQVQKGSGKIEEQTTQLKTILTNLDGQAKQIDEGLDDIISTIDEYDPIATKQRAKDIIASGDDPAATGFAKSVDVGVSDDLQKSLDLTDSFGFQVTKDLDDVVPFNELSLKDIEMVKLGVPMNSKTYRREMEAINKGEMAPSQMSGISGARADTLKTLEDELLGGMDMKTYTKVNDANIAEKERIMAVANDLIEEGRMTEARELLESIGEDLSADRVLNANGGRIGFQDGGESNYYIGGRPATEEEYNMQGDYMDLTPEGMDLFKAFRLENPDVDENIILDALKKQGYSGDMQGFASGGGVGSLFRMR